MVQWIITAVCLAGGVLQLYAAFSTARREGPLRTTQARQLESVLGRKGTVAFFAIVGVLLTAGGIWGAISLVGG